MKHLVYKVTKVNSAFHPFDVQVCLAAVTGEGEARSLVSGDS